MMMMILGMMMIKMAHHNRHLLPHPSNPTRPHLLPHPLNPKSSSVAQVIRGSRGVVFTVEVNHRRTKPWQSPSLKSSESIKTVCAVTQHPDTCFTDVVSVNSGNNTVNPMVIFNLTLQLAVTELTNVSSLPKTLISNSNDLRTGSTLGDCVNLFDDAVSQLSRSVESMRGESVLTVEKVGDLKTWISAAMRDQETWDGIDGCG
ncbi:putative pectinesterase [Helianthus anomalus]